MRYIDQQKIYDETEHGLTIFQHFFPGEDFSNPKKNFKLRPEEKTASARVVWHSGFWRVTDFGAQDKVNGMKAIDFVVYSQNLPYYDALRYIEQVIIGREVDATAFKKSKFTADYSFREMTPDDKKKQYNFTFKEKPSVDDLASIGRYVTEDTLDLFHCRAVESYEYCSSSKGLNRDVVHKFIATKDYPMFLFDYGKFKKLYKPHDLEKKNRFLYVGEKPKEYVYGLEQLERAKNEFVDSETGDIKTPEEKADARVIDLFRCSGESDALNLASLGFHVYWLNSESATFDYAQFKLLDDLCENHYQIMDLDTTGRDQAVKNALKHISLYSIELPKWLGFKKDFRGNPCKDLKDFINLCGNNMEVTQYSFTVLKRNSCRVKFWDKTVKDKAYTYSINMEYYFFFLKVHGFYQTESKYFKGDEYCYCRITGKTVELIPPAQIKRTIKKFTREWLAVNGKMEAQALRNKIIGSTQISEGTLDTIDEVKLNFKNHDQFTEYIHFRNGSVKVTKNKIELVKHESIPNYILGYLKVNGKEMSHLIDRDMRVLEKPAIEVNATPEYQSLLDRQAAAKTDQEKEAINVTVAQFPDMDKYKVTMNDDFIFAKFLRDLSRLYWRKEVEGKVKLSEDELKEQDLSLANLMFVLGYHCAQYKDDGKAWLTLMQDMKISEVGKSSGGSGKSLYSKAVGYVRTAFYKGGRNLNDKNQYQFFYDGFTEFHDFIEIDDMHQFAEFGFFYTQITGNREINPKNYTAFTLAYKDSGKMLISTNYELMNMDNSTVRRLLNCGVSDYYHDKSKFNDYKESRSPLTKFGRSMYLDFTEDEWVKFYNVVAYCIQLQQRFFKIQPPMVNLEKRQLLLEMTKGLGMGGEFFAWCNEYFVLKPEGLKIDESPSDIGYFNTYIVKEDAYKNFCEHALTMDQAKKYKATKFKSHIQSFCEYYGYELNPVNLQNAQGRIVRNVNNVTKECFFISTRNPKQGYSDDPISNPIQDPPIIDFNNISPDEAPF